ncbi:hypothetical protein [Inediibacterium massiliense]|uniref:hypothetical protein n=1 Tax=Inediibacterium massiliense TaxID=1658111 RepID=UPI0006B653E4|nr:hypothetical protein [Inediibacterium massiliense]
MNNLKKFNYIPYIATLVCLFISTLIAGIHHMSFEVFIKRTGIFYIIIFISLKFFIKNMMKSLVDKPDENKIDLVIPPEDLTEELLSEGDDEFIPLNLENNEIKHLHKTDHTTTES